MDRRDDTFPCRIVALTTFFDDLCLGYRGPQGAYYGYVDIKNWNNSSAVFDIDNAKLALGYNPKIAFAFNLLTRGSTTESILNSIPPELKGCHCDDKGNNQRYCGYYIEQSRKNYMLLKIANGMLRFRKQDPIIQ